MRGRLCSLCSQDTAGRLACPLCAISELDHVKQHIAALQQEQQRLHQLTLEAQASLTQLSKEQAPSQQWASLEWVKQREQQYTDTQSQLLAALERRFELTDEIAKAQKQLEQLQRSEVLPDENNEATL
mgnify:CR=1 FL=1